MPPGSPRWLVIHTLANRFLYHCVPLITSLKNPHNLYALIYQCTYDLCHSKSFTGYCTCLCQTVKLYRDIIVECLGGMQQKYMCGNT